MGFDFSSIFGSTPHRRSATPAPIEQVEIQRPLHRLMAFTGHTIDQIINCPIAKRKVLGYYKLHRWIERASEVSELEKQWNRLA